MELSFLKEICKTEKEAKPVSTMFGNKLKIKIAALKPEDYIDQPEIYNTFFKNGNIKLDRFHIPELSAKEYTELVGGDVSSTSPNANLEIASDYYKRKMRLRKVARALNTTENMLDLTDYIWDERYYLCYNLIDNMRLVDDWYRDHGDDDRYTITAWQNYITEDYHTCVVNREVFDNLYTFCVNTIKQRKAMLFGDIDKCLQVLRNIIEYTEGFTLNATRPMCASMQKYIDKYNKMLSDKEFCEFIKHNNDLTVFAHDPEYRSEYVTAYKSLIKSLVSGSDEDVIQLKDLLSTLEDPYLDKILEPTIELDSTPWLLQA